MINNIPITRPQRWIPFQVKSQNSKFKNENRELLPSKRTGSRIYFGTAKVRESPGFEKRLFEYLPFYYKYVIINNLSIN